MGVMSSLVDLLTHVLVAETHSWRMRDEGYASVKAFDS